MGSCSIPARQVATENTVSRIFLINIGANSAHSSVARSPRFSNGSFIFVPFPNPGGNWIRDYPSFCRPFVRTTSLDTHDDPDWQNLTYGDDCANGRAASLQRVTEGDILLFWGMLWGTAETLGMTSTDRMVGICLVLFV